MPENDVDTFIEFTQAYEDGARVIKRGMEASPMVVRKYALGEDEVVALSSWHGDNRALTAFHFHPSFPVADRRDYMRKHEDGIALLDEVRNRKNREGLAELGLHAGRWETFKQHILDLGGLFERFAMLLARSLRPVSRPAPPVEASPDVVEPKEPGSIVEAPVAVALLSEKQRQALPESFARAGALPHWERGYENGPLSQEELIALKGDKAHDPSGRPVSPTVH